MYLKYFLISFLFISCKISRNENKIQYINCDFDNKSKNYEINEKVNQEFIKINEISNFELKQSIIKFTNIYYLNFPKNDINDVLYWVCKICNNRRFNAKETDELLKTVMFTWSDNKKPIQKKFLEIAKIINIDLINKLAINKSVCIWIKQNNYSKLFELKDELEKEKIIRIISLGSTIYGVNGVKFDNCLEDININNDPFPSSKFTIVKLENFNKIFEE